MCACAAAASVGQKLQLRPFYLNFISLEWIILSFPRNKHINRLGKKPKLIRLCHSSRVRSWFVPPSDNVYVENRSLEVPDDDIIGSG
jgi:hypothetical protein